MAVNDGNERLQLAMAEPGLKSFNCLRRERDFWHEHNRALPLLKRVSNRLEVNLRFAASRDAMKQKDPRRIKTFYGCMRRFGCAGNGHRLAPAEKVELEDICRERCLTGGIQCRN